MVATGKTSFLGWRDLISAIFPQVTLLIKIKKKLMTNQLFMCTI